MAVFDGELPLILDMDGEALDPTAFPPAIDPEDGTFDGPFPPTNGVTLSFAPFVARLLPTLNLQARIDSVKPDWTLQEACIGGWEWNTGTCYRMWLTVGDSSYSVEGESPNWGGGNGFGGNNFSETLVVNNVIPFDPQALEDFQVPPGQSGTATAILTVDEGINSVTWEGERNRRLPLPTEHGGPRWFNGTEETLADPAAYIRVGALAEVDSVYIPIHHTEVGPGLGQMANSGSIQYMGYYISTMGRAADIRVTWSGGTITARDVSNNVDVPFSGQIGSSWGFLNDDGDGDGIITFWDFFCVGDGVAEWEIALGVGCTGAVMLQPTPAFVTMALEDVAGTSATTLNGYTLFLNGMRHFFVADVLPPDGTVWTLRTYNGRVESLGGLETENPRGYTWTSIWDDAEGQLTTGRRSPLIPGLTFVWQVESNTVLTGPTDLTQVHTVPDPYLATSALDLAPTEKRLQFVNLPPQASIRIYTLTGILVDQVEHDDITGGGRAVWDLRNRNDQFVASGVYFFHVITPDGEAYVGKFTVVNFASQ